MQKNVLNDHFYVQKNVSLLTNHVQKNVSNIMERLVLQRLKEWKERKDRKPLIVNGARQVGKTWALREFAKREYAKEAYIICRKNELVEQVFKHDFNVGRILLSLSAIINVDPAQILVNNQIFSEYKGGMTEEYVLQEMKSRNISPIYYHKTDDSRLELDFVIQYKGKLLPIEVKAEGNVRANSLTNLLKANPNLQAVRLSMLPYKQQEQLFCVPLYVI